MARRKATAASGRKSKAVVILPEREQKEKTLALPCVNSEDVEVKPYDWLSPGRLALGCVWILDGTKSTGKSSIAAAIAAAVTGSNPLPGGERREWGQVLWFAGEEDLGTVRSKLERAEARMKYVQFPGKNIRGEVVASLAIAQHEDVLQATVEEHHARLIVLDTLSCFVGSVDLNQELSARSVMSVLTRISQATGCLIFCIRHPRKTPVSNPLDRGMGNPAISAAARGVLTTGKEPDSGRSVLGVLACNIGKRAPTICYEVIDLDGVPCVQWGPEIPLEAERIEFGVVEEGIQIVRLEAKMLLRKRIGGSWVPAADVIAEARKNGISQDALDRARHKLGVQSRRVGKLGSDGHWEYGPPEGGWSATM